MPSQTNPERSLGFLLHEVARLMRRDFNYRVKDLGLTQAQWRALAHLSRNEGINQIGLADLLEVRPITLARLIDRLQEAGWVERRADPADRRAFRLFLTPQADPLVKEMQAAAAATRELACSGLTAAQRAALIEALCALKRNLLAADKARADSVPEEPAIE